MTHMARLREMPSNTRIRGLDGPGVRGDHQGMDDKTRTAIYLQQSGRKELTGKQKKRAAQKENKRLGAKRGKKK